VGARGFARGSESEAVMGWQFGNDGKVFIGDMHIGDLESFNANMDSFKGAKLWLPGDDAEPFADDLPAGLGIGFLLSPVGLWLPKSIAGPSSAVCTYTTAKHAIKGSSISELLAVKETLDAMKKSQESQKPMSLFGLPVVEVPFLSNDLPTVVEYHLSTEKMFDHVAKMMAIPPFVFGAPLYSIPMPEFMLGDLTQYFPHGRTRSRQLEHDDAHLFAKPDTKDRGQQFDDQEILRSAGGHRCQYVWSEWLQAHVQIGEPL
jgi:hypothetical protein